jgi:hypothetical protein
MFIHSREVFYDLELSNYHHIMSDESDIGHIVTHINTCFLNKNVAIKD